MRYRIPLVAVLLISGACDTPGVTGPGPAKSELLPNASRLSPTDTYEFVLECRKDASAASNVGLTVLSSSFQLLYSNAFSCDQPVSVGPGAGWVYYNINVYESFSHRFSCDSGWYVAIVPGNKRCTLRDAGFTSDSMNGIWASLRIRKE